MSVTPEEQLRSLVLQLAELCLQNAASAEQVARLEQLLQAHPDARRIYLEFMQDSYSLRKWALAQAEKVDSESSPLGPPTRDPHAQPTEPTIGPTPLPVRQSIPPPAARRTATRPRRRRNLIQNSLIAASVVASLAAVMLIAVRVNWQPRSVVASIVDVKDGVWLEDTPLVTGAELLEMQQLGLKAGVARIRFTGGATVTLEGPAELQVLSAAATRLRSGILTCYVPPQAVGFRVRTDALDLTDLGTSFGVEVAAGGRTNVSVFAGSVEVTVPDAGLATGKIVKRGESVRVDAGQASIDSVAFMADRFRVPLQRSTGVDDTSGDCRFVAQPAIGGAFPENNEHILVGPERLNVTVPTDLRINIGAEHAGVRERRRQAAPIPAGTRVDCFLVQFRPAPNAITRPGLSAEGSITFDRPIVGIITRSSLLTQTDELFAGGKTDFEQNRRGGEQRGNPRETDTLFMSSDRRTIEVTSALRGQMDQIRVLVAATDNGASLNNHLENNVTTNERGQ